MGIVNYDENELFEKLSEVIEINPVIILVVLITPEGLPITSITKEKERLDSSTLINYGAMAAAAASLSVRTISTLSTNDTARVISVKAVDGHVAVALSDRLLSLIVTEKQGDAKKLALEINQNFKGYI